MLTKVYRYGLLPPDQNQDQVYRAIRLAHEYRNRLVEIDRQERSEIRALQVSHGPIPALEAAAKAAGAAKAAAYAQIRAHKGQGRTRQVPEPLKAAYEAAKESARDAVRALSQARAALRQDTTVTEKRDEINLRYSEKRRQARGSSGVYWGTYLRVEAADQAARRTTPLWDGTEPHDVRFARWRGDGAIAVQIQSGPAPDELHSNSFCRIETRAAPAGSNPQSKRSAKRRYASLLVRIGTDSERQPIWARFPMVMHRPMPPDSTISWVTVTCRHIGPRQEWAALFTVRYEKDARPRPPPEPVNRVGIDIGWRKLNGGDIRVATWQADNGRSGFLVLDEHMMSQLSKADGLRATRDKNLEVAKAALVERMKSLALPDWFPKNVWQWRAAARFSSLARRWKANRFAGDDLAYAELESWRYHDHHLWAWETSQRTKALRHRLDFYRKFAAEMAKTYTSLVLEDFDLRDIARKPEAHQQEDDNHQARSNRVRGSTSELRQALKQAFAGSVTEVPAEYTTQTCSACGSRQLWDQAAELEHTCTACGARWDQDQNAAKNLLAYRPPPAAADEKTSDVSESKWVKAKRMGKEKRGRVEAARNQTAGAAE